MASIFYVMLLLFAMIGLLRGWAKEIIATMGVVLALFALQQFGPALLDETLMINVDQGDIVNMLPDQRQGIVPDPNTLAQRSQQFVLQAGFLLVVTFFAYQTPTAAALWSARRGGGPGGRLDMLGQGLVNRMMGLVIGLLNGYLVVGSVWYYAHRLGYPFGEFVIPAPPFATVAGHGWTLERVLETAGYQQTVGLVNQTNQIIASLPLTFIGDLLPLLVVVLFLFMLIVMI